MLSTLISRADRARALLEQQGTPPADYLVPDIYGS